MANKSFPVFDGDSHVVEPAELWTKYLEPEYRTLGKHALWREEGKLGSYLKVNGKMFRDTMNSNIPRHAIWQPGMTWESVGGLEGIKLAREMRPLAITLDVMMPDLDGWSVLAALRQDAQLTDTPVIMVTILDEHRRGMTLGAAGYLVKPIERERLHNLMQRFRSSAPTTRVLLVEDDLMQRERVRLWFEGEHWTVVEAANGREALAQMREALPNLILLDLMMPEMDGFQVVDALQENLAWRDIPVIVVTSRDLDATERARLNSGVQSILIKESFKAADLVARIRRLVGAGKVGATEVVS